MNPLVRKSDLDLNVNEEDSSSSSSLLDRNHAKQKKKDFLSRREIERKEKESKPIPKEREKRAALPKIGAAQLDPWGRHCRVLLLPALGIAMIEIIQETRAAGMSTQSWSCIRVP